MKRIISLVSALVFTASLNVNAMISPQIDGGVADRCFDENRTLYYIKPTGKDIPEITAEGATILKKATDFSVNNVTLIKDNSNNKEYRFVIEAASPVIITGYEISPNGVLTVGGNFKQSIGFIVLKPVSPYSQISYKDSDVDFNNNADISQKALDMMNISCKNGKISYTFPSTADSGMYRIIIGNQNGENAFVDAYYTNKADAVDLVTALNTIVKSQSDLDSVIEKYCHLLKIDLNEYKNFFDKSIYYDFIVEKEFSAENITVLVSEAKKATVLTEINNAASPKTKAKYYIDNADVLSLNMNNVYSEINGKENFTDFLSSVKVRTVSAALEEFNKAAALCYIAEADNNNIKTRFEKVKTDLKLSTEALNKYNNLSDVQKEKILSRLLNMKAVTSEVFSKNLLSAMNESSVIVPSSTSSSGSGSKSSSSGGSGITIPNIKEKEPDSEKPVYEASNAFTDIDNVSWAKEAILLLKEKNAISGKSKDIFAPDDYVTREEFIKMLILAIDYDTSKDKVDFKDISPEDWFYDAVSAGVKAGIVKGISEDVFGVGYNITRQDMAVMIYRAALASQINITGYEIINFIDYDNIADYAQEAVKTLTKCKIISGMNDGSFMPQATATRAQAAKMIYNLISKD